MHRLAFIMVLAIAASAGAQDAPTLLVPDERAQSARGVERNAAAAADNDDQPDALDRLFRKLAIEAMPRAYEDDDDWGRTKQFTTGLHIAREGLKIETRRKRSQLNDGLWERYRVALADEEQFTLDVRDVRLADTGRAAFTIEVAAPLKAHARRARWRRGVQLWNISADAQAHVRLVLECTAGLRLDATELPPALVLTPEVVDAEIHMTRFQLKGVSKVRGEAADAVGDALRAWIEREVAAKDDKLVRKLNQRIAKNQDRWRISLASLAGSPLGKLAPSHGNNHRRD